MVDAAEVHQIGLPGFERNDHRREVGALFGAVKAQNAHAEFFGFVAKVFRDALAVKRFVVNDVDRFELEILRREAGADGALDVVAAAHAIDVRIAAIGVFRCRVRR